MLSVHTLSVNRFIWQKNQPLLIYHSNCSRDSQEPKTKTIFQFSRWLFQKIPFLYFFLRKSWIWRTLGHVMEIFSYCHFHNASKECFWPKKFLNFLHMFKSAILEKSRIYAGKSTNRGFSKKAIARIEKLFQFQVPMNLSRTPGRINQKWLSFVI